MALRKTLSPVESEDSDSAMVCANRNKNSLKTHSLTRSLCVSLEFHPFFSIFGSLQRPLTKASAPPPPGSSNFAVPVVCLQLQSEFILLFFSCLNQIGVPLIYAVALSMITPLRARLLSPATLSSSLSQPSVSPRGFLSVFRGLHSSE